MPRSLGLPLLPVPNCPGLTHLSLTCVTRGRDCHLLMVDAPGPLGGDTSQPEALFTLGCTLPRGPRPLAAVISHCFLPRRCGSAFLKLEQQLSLRRRLGWGQAGPLALGPSRGVARIASTSLLMGCGPGLGFLQRHPRRGARSRTQCSR